ncbi:F-box/LRR-repeat protein At3g58900-like [Coffea arabica]|uniref:F-box/LRR-repeat protein At3g58900-like n=1 Tax=Coffea arabica TaxID=13443 RepID=A0A6P6WM62_COFAR
MEKTAKKAQAEGSEDDGISKLPEDIMQYILSNFLTPKEAAQTRLLSKAWWSAWHTSPVVCFCEPNFGKSSNPEFCRAMFLNFVNKVLLNYREHNHRIQTFKLQMIFNTESAQLVDEWMKIAIEKGLRKLELRTYEKSYILPSITLESRSLEELVLYNCKFEQKQVIKHIMCRSLRRLDLENVFLVDEVLENIILNCRLIENLNIHHCDGLRNITVKDLKKLKEFSVIYDGEQNVQVYSPNLESFTCQRGSWYCQSIRGRLRLFATQNLKLLVLNGICITDEFFLGLGNVFPHIEELKVSNSNDTHRIKISSQSLRKMELICNEKLEEVQVDAPKIVQFVYVGSSIPRVSITSAPLSHLESRIGVNCNNNVNNSWFFKLKEMLTNLGQSKVFLGISIRADVTVNLNEIRDGPTNPTPEIEELSVEVVSYCASKQTTAAALLDACFWSFRPKIILQEWCFRGTIYFTQFLLELLMISRNQDHLNLLETTFWLKNLKDVKVVVMKRSGLNDEWQPELSDWKPLLYSCDDGGFNTAVHFNLEWW